MSNIPIKNQSYFLVSRSRILIKTGTQRDCNELLPIMFKIHDFWFRSMPRLVETIPLPNIQLLTYLIWKYVNPASLATSGISTSDLNRLRNHTMFPVEKSSMLNTTARGAMKQCIPKGSLFMMNLLDEQSLDKMAESTGTCLWKSFVIFRPFR